MTENKTFRNRENDLNFLLKEINLVREKYILLDDSKEKFNIFSTLMIETDEVCLHSRFISSLLDPHGPHGLGMKPLSLLCECLDSSLSFSEHVEVIPNNVTWTEHRNIDILIRDRFDRTCIIIENKIGAGDSNHDDRGQLEGYYQTILKEDFSPEKIEVYYLTPDRHEPSELSLSTNGLTPELKEKVQCIDYPHEIISWLRKVASAAYDKPYLRETILQYIDLINKMTGELESPGEKGFEISDQPDENDISTIIHGGPVQKKKVGFTYVINDKQGISWTLEEDADYKKGFYIGIEKDRNKSLSKEVKEVIKGFAKDKDSNDFWYCWKYITDLNGPALFFWDFLSTDRNTFDILSPTKRRDIISDITRLVMKEIQALDSLIRR